MTNPRRKSLAAAAGTVAPKPVPKPDLDLDGLERAERQLKTTGQGKRKAPSPKAERGASGGREVVAVQLTGPMKRLSIDLPEDLFVEFKLHATRERTTMKRLVEELIRNAVDRG